VDPDGARNQLEGGIIQGASWALLEEVRHEEGRVNAAGWEEYPILTFRDVPRNIEIAFTDDGRTPPTGLGEPGVVPIGAALANAVFAACGVRIRQLPLQQEYLRVR
jgi:CO/xanthine dehydrogenase Mo-binding subunit